MLLLQDQPISTAEAEPPSAVIPSPVRGLDSRPPDQVEVDAVGRARRRRPGYGRLAINEPAMREVRAAARRHFTLDRIPTWALFAALWGTVPPALRLTSRLDDGLYPEWRDQPVRSPVFIFANARSGTTLLHRLMSHDEEQFSSMRLYQSFVNTVSIQRGIQTLARLDARTPFHPLRRLVDAINARFFSGWDGIHPLGIDEYEEDETSFVVCMNSITINLLLPYTDEFPSLRFLDHLDDEYRERFMDYYEATIQRHLYASAPDKRFLDKNVFLTPRVKSLHQRFPDARFIHLTRHPYEAVPSFLNMWFEKWVTHSPDLRRDGPEIRALFELAVDYSLYALELRDILPGRTLYDMRYDELIEDPGRAVADIYDWLGEPMSAAFSAKVADASARQRRYGSTHDYALESFGISREEIFARLSPVFDAYGFGR